MRTVLFLIAALFIAGPAFAKDIKHTEAGVQYSLPDAWTIEKDGGLVSTIAPSQDLFGLFMGVEQANLEKWLDQMPAMLDGMEIKNFTPAGEPQEGDINGMPAILLAGTGVTEGKKVEIGITIVVPPNSTNALILLGMNEPGADKKHEAALNGILQSLKPL